MIPLDGKLVAAAEEEEEANVYRCTLRANSLTRMTPPPHLGDEEPGVIVIIVVVVVELAVVQGLTFVHFSAQTQPLWSLKFIEITHRIPESGLTSGRKGDECKPLPSSSKMRGGSSSSMSAGSQNRSSSAPRARARHFTYPNLATPRRCSSTGTTKPLGLSQIPITPRKCTAYPLQLNVSPHSCQAVGSSQHEYP